MATGTCSIFPSAGPCLFFEQRRLYSTFVSLLPLLPVHNALPKPVASSWNSICPYLMLIGYQYNYVCVRRTFTDKERISMADSLL